jgi:hypothetical protein
VVFYLIKSINDYLGNEPSSIEAVAKLLEAFPLDRIIGYFLGFGGILYGLRERKGKQRAISEKAEFQQLAEKTDEFRSTSGLTKIGTTPKDTGRPYE